MNCLHPGFLLAAGTRAAILRAGLVELPRQVEQESAAGRIVDSEVAIAEEDGIGLVAIEEIDAAQVDCQLPKVTQMEVLLQAKTANDTWLGDTEIVVLALSGPLHVGTQPEGVRQFNGVSP